MLVDEGGRFHTVRVKEDYLKMFKEDMANLSPDELEVAKIVLNDLKAYGKSPILDIGSASLYRSPPVSMTTFLDDTYFCGKISKQIFPQIRQDLEELFTGQYDEAILGGSIGCIAEDTLLETVEGKRRAGDIQGCTYYLSYDRDRDRFGHHLGTAPFPKGKGTLFRVVHEQGEFIAYEQHLVLGCGYYRTVESIVSGDYIVSPSGPSGCLSEVKSKEKFKTDWYWDLQVPHTNNYVAEGAVHHNSGKSTFARFAILRMLYEASCLNDPFETYGVQRSDSIAFPCIAVTEAKANELVFDKIEKAIQDIPYFNNEFKPTSITQKSGIVFPNGLWIPPGLSTENRALGINAFSAIIEEANFFKPLNNTNPNKSNNPDLAEAIYKSIKRRMESRFLTKGRLPGIIIIISSKTAVNSFTERRIQEAASNPRIFIRESSVYEVVPERFGKKKFKIAIGNQNKASRILAEDEAEPEGMKVIQVPVELRQAFENDLEGSIREIAGYASVSITPFIAKRDKIGECIDTTRVHPFSEYVWSHDVPGRFLWEHLAKQKKDGSWEPLYHPHAPRFFALDMSKNGDATGVAMGCLGPYVQIKRMGNEPEMVPSFHIDFVLRVEAATKGEIIQSELRNLIYDLTNHGFFIKQASADSYQSVGILQTLGQQGYKTKTVSVDISNAPYELLKLAIYENRLSFYDYSPLKKELRELQKNWKSGKVDHPNPSEIKGASKDVSDAMCQVVLQIDQAATTMFVNSPLEARSFMSENEDGWVMENGAIPVEESNNPDNLKEEWRKNAEQKIALASPIADWKTDFQMPFSQG